MTCTARLKAWSKPDGEFSCRLPADTHAVHIATGLFEHQTIQWLEGDRRQFTGRFHRCDQSTCILPVGHHGSHAGMTLHAVVELMGHRTRAGAISDAQMGGATLLRIEHPTRADHTGTEPLAEFYVPAAIFSIRPCSEEEAARVAAWAWGEAVARPALGPAFVELVDDDEDLDEPCECDDENCPECENRIAATRSHESPF